MLYTSRKKLNGLVHRMSKDIINKDLAHAFKMLKSAGLTIRVAQMDDEKRPQVDDDKDPRRINVVVVGGRVLRCWVG